MNEEDVDSIKAKIAEAEKFIEGLESGHLRIGHPSENRTEAKVLDLKRQVAMWQSILIQRNVGSA